MPGLYDIYEGREQESKAADLGFGVTPSALGLLGLDLGGRWLASSAFTRATGLTRTPPAPSQRKYLREYRRARGEVFRGFEKAYYGGARFGVPRGRVVLAARMRRFPGVALSDAAAYRLSGRAAVGLTAKAMGRVGGLGMLVSFGASVGEGLFGAVMDWRPRSRLQSPHEFGSVFYDPRGAFTQRQRALMAINDSQLQTRAALGNEAALLHA